MLELICLIFNIFINETPLHLAIKGAFIDVIDALLNCQNIRLDIKNVSLFEISKSFNIYILIMFNIIYWV